jgi:(S)-2-hydroxy-acid oxidase
VSNSCSEGLAKDGIHLFTSHTVLNPADVETAIRYGIDGVLVSNHGGRQLDGVPATLDALRECAPVARDRIQIAVDGGIRRGSDIFKALAMGAQHCFLGRIPIWGLAVGSPKS